jgi:hypothetical protein
MLSEIVCLFKRGMSKIAVFLFHNLLTRFAFDTELLNKNFGLLVISLGMWLNGADWDSADLVAHAQVVNDFIPVFKENYHPTSLSLLPTFLKSLVNITYAIPTCQGADYT